MLGFDFTVGKATVSGSGDTLISFTARRDVARFVTHVLTALPLSQLSGRTFRIEGERTVRPFATSSTLVLLLTHADGQSFNALLAAYEAKSGKTLEITRRPRSALEQALSSNPADFASALLLSWDLGGGLVGGVDELDNSVWEDWKPKKVLEVLLPNA